MGRLHHTHSEPNIVRQFSSHINLFNAVTPKLDTMTRDTSRRKVTIAEPTTRAQTITPMADVIEPFDITTIPATIRVDKPKTTSQQSNQNLDFNGARVKKCLSIKDKGCTNLDNYIKQVQTNLLRNKNHFSYNFSFFKHSRGISRHINVLLAQALKDKLANAKDDLSCLTFLTDKAIEELRRCVIKENNIKLGHFSKKGIHSKILNSVISSISEDINGYRIATQISMNCGPIRGGYSFP